MRALTEQMADVPDSFRRGGFSDAQEDRLKTQSECQFRVIGVRATGLRRCTVLRFNVGVRSHSHLWNLRPTRELSPGRYSRRPTPWVPPPATASRSPGTGCRRFCAARTGACTPRSHGRVRAPLV